MPVRSQFLRDSLGLTRLVISIFNILHDRLRCRDFEFAVDRFEFR